VSPLNVFSRRPEVVGGDEVVEMPNDLVVGVEFVCKRWTTEPERFRLNPLQQTPGLNRDGSPKQQLKGYFDARHFIRGAIAPGGWLRSTCPTGRE
jgi:hypothetical protein